ncbi:MAG: hydrogenase small subunit [Anaerolineae bacterium]
MRLTRRAFMRYVAFSATALGISQLQLDQLNTVLAAPSAPPVLWLIGSGCTGCSVSLLNATSPTIDTVLTETINLKFHPTLMTASGDLAVNALSEARQAGGYVLVVEGAIPTASSGRYCIVYDENGSPVTMLDAVTSLAANAAAVVAVGTCAAYGGISKACPDTSAQGLSTVLGRAVVNLPGCPTHPDWIVGSLVALLTAAPLPLDGNSRPTTYYKSKVIHERCPRREIDDASRLGQSGCLEKLGCKGTSSHADCESRKWNNGRNWCIGANALCIGCTEPNFPAFPFHGEGDED